MKLESYTKMQEKMHQLEQTNRGLEKQLKDQQGVNKAQLQTISQLKIQNNALLKAEHDLDAKTVSSAAAAKQACELGMHRQEVEKSLLKAQLTAAQAKINQDDLTIKDLGKKLQTVQHLYELTKTQATSKLETLKDQIGQYRDHIVALRDSVSQNIAARKQSEKRIVSLEKMLIESNAKMLEAKLKQYQATMESVQQSLTTAQIAEAD